MNDGYTTLDNMIEAVVAIGTLLAIYRDDCQLWGGTSNCSWTANSHLGWGLLQWHFQRWQTLLNGWCGAKGYLVVWMTFCLWDQPVCQQTLNCSKTPANPREFYWSYNDHGLPAISGTVSLPQESDTNPNWRCGARARQLGGTVRALVLTWDRIPLKPMVVAVLRNVEWQAMAKRSNTSDVLGRMGPLVYSVQVVVRCEHFCKGTVTHCACLCSVG